MVNKHILVDVYQILKGNTVRPANNSTCGEHIIEELDFIFREEAMTDLVHSEAQDAVNLISV